MVGRTSRIVLTSFYCSRKWQKIEEDGRKLAEDGRKRYGTVTDPGNKRKV